MRRRDWTGAIIDRPHASVNIRREWPLSLSLPQTDLWVELTHILELSLGCRSFFRYCLLVQRDWMTTFQPAFRGAIIEGKARSVMCSCKPQRSSNLAFLLVVSVCSGRLLAIDWH